LIFKLTQETIGVIQSPAFRYDQIEVLLEVLVYPPQAEQAAIEERDDAKDDEESKGEEVIQDQDWQAYHGVARPTESCEVYLALKRHAFRHDTVCCASHNEVIGVR